jgi:outer membrane protein W
MIISFGGRYYVRKEGKVKPYLQLGINQETQYREDAGYNFYYFLNAGIGFNVKISGKFSFDMKYDLNKTLDKKVTYSFNGFSVLAGLKYNL